MGAWSCPACPMVGAEAQSVALSGETIGLAKRLGGDEVPQLVHENYSTQSDRNLCKKPQALKRNESKD